MITIEARYIGGIFDGGIEKMRFENYDNVYTTIDVYPDGYDKNNSLPIGRYILEDLKQDVATYKFQYLKKEIKNVG